MDFKQIATKSNDQWLVKFLIGISKLLSAGDINTNGADKLADYARNNHKHQQEIINTL